jgi:hypothetical protein
VSPCTVVNGVGLWIIFCTTIIYLKITTFGLTNHVIHRSMLPNGLTVTKLERLQISSWKFTETVLRRILLYGIVILKQIHIVVVILIAIPQYCTILRFSDRMRDVVDDFLVEYIFWWRARHASIMTTAHSRMWYALTLPTTSWVPRWLVRPT